MKRAEYHDRAIKFLKEYTSTKSVVICSGVMIVNPVKFCKVQLDLLEGTNSQRVYKVAMLHVIRFKKVVDKMN